MPGQGPGRGAPRVIEWRRRERLWSADHPGRRPLILAVPVCDGALREILATAFEHG